MKANPLPTNNIAFGMIVIVTFIFGTMFFWYISQPIANSMLSITQGLTQTLDIDTAGSNNTYTILRFIITVSGGLISTIMIVYLFVYASRKEWSGYYE